MKYKLPTFRASHALEMARPYPSAHARPTPGHHHAMVGGGGHISGHPGSPFDQGGPSGLSGLSEVATRECRAAADRFDVARMAEERTAPGHVLLRCTMSQYTFRFFHCIQRFIRLEKGWA